MAGVMKHTMVLRNPDTLEATALLEGSELPEWAVDLVDGDNLVDGDAADDGGDDGPNYAGQKVGELEAEAATRGLEVEGTGTNGKVVKADLVAALEADDAAQAE